jgi:superfamily II DNA/RNA helicase
MTFSDLGLSQPLLDAINAAGYSTPTPIQEGAIPVALQGRDVLGIAQTGTGKTASFVLPMIEMLSRGRARARMPRSLIITPTRELAAQIAENFEKYGKNHKLSMALLIGGVSFGDQDKLLTQGVDVLIATPGRLLDHFERGKLLLTGVQVMVVDEADRMLDMGFIPDIERIFKLTPFTRQTLFFSATMPPEITRLTEQFLHSPARIEVARASSTATTVTQAVVHTGSNDGRVKRATLRRIIEATNPVSGIVFCNRKTEVDILAKSLVKYGYNAAPIHGDLEQSQRTKTLDAFRSGELKLLIASDVAARGLDIPDVGHVYNFDVPRHAEDYVHRIGRTGRAGRSGEAFTLVSPADSKSLAGVEALIGSSIPVRDEFVVSDDERDVLVAEGRAREARASGRPDRKQGGRDRSRGRQSDRGEARNVAEQTERAPRPERAPRTERSERPARGEGRERPARNERPNRENSENRPQREARSDAPREPRPRQGSGGPKGFAGEHMPAFFRIAEQAGDKKTG